MKPLIQKLVSTLSPSGSESAVRAVIRTEIEGLVDEIRVDNLGNLIARKGAGRPGGLKIMLSAHMDEIGLIATHVDPNGFVRFTSLGGVNPSLCPYQRVRFMNGVPGIIGVERLLDPGKKLSFEHLYIDLGVTSRKDCPVQTGDAAGFESDFCDLGNRLVSKAMDDRIGIAVLIETLRVLSTQPELDHQVFFTFTTQEEVGTRGVVTAAYAIEPDLGLAVDVTAVGDTPAGLKMDVALGKGPAIKVRDLGMLADPRVVRWMVRTAEAEHIPYQYEILQLGSTDAAAIQISRQGVPSGCLSIPTRYVHSVSEMVDYHDVQNSVALLVALLRRPIQLEAPA